MLRSICFAALLVAAAAAQAQPSEPAPPPGIEAVLAHPPFADPYLCSEHASGELPYPGDDLGQDCLVAAFDKDKPTLFMRLYRTDGATNEDWYGWGKPVHAPCDCTVAKRHVNPVVNAPGQPNPGRATALLLQRADGTMFMVAHLGTITANEGDVLKAGDVIGTVGNNGFSRTPHIHIGAWRGKQALQIRWDQRAMKIH